MCSFIEEICVCVLKWYRSRPGRSLKIKNGTECMKIKILTKSHKSSLVSHVFCLTGETGNLPNRTEASVDRDHRQLEPQSELSDTFYFNIFIPATGTTYWNVFWTKILKFSIGKPT